MATEEPSAPAKITPLAAIFRHLFRRLLGGVVFVTPIAVTLFIVYKIYVIFNGMVVEPLGAFYFFFRVDSCFGDDITDSVEFCQKLIADEGVALVPGEAFGDDRWIRLSFAASEENIREALERIVRFINGLVDGDERRRGHAVGN